MEFTNKNVGMKIRNRRLELSMTQEELAHKVGYKTKGSINKLETTRDIPINKLKPIADALEIDVKVLMGWDDDSEKYSTENADIVMDALDNPLILDIIKELLPLEGSYQLQALNHIKLLRIKQSLDNADNK